MRGIVSTGEVARGLGISTSTLHDLIRNGDPANALGDAVRRSVVPMLRGRYCYAQLRDNLARIGIEFGDAEDVADYLGARIAELQERVERLESVVHS